MAVGIPRKSGSLDQQHGSRLEYSGKKTAEAILAVPTGYYESIHGTGPNRLYHADNIGVLSALARDHQVAGKVRLIYIDPPFSTASIFESRKQRIAYTDDLTGPAFIESLRERLIWLHRLLADDGSLYLHLDERMTSYMRVILDEIFGPKNFRACITRKKCNPKNYTRKSYGSVADYILFYSKTDTYMWNRPSNHGTRCGPRRSTGMSIAMDDSTRRCLFMRQVCEMARPANRGAGNSRRLGSTGSTFQPSLTKWT